LARSTSYEAPHYAVPSNLRHFISFGPKYSPQHPELSRILEKCREEFRPEADAGLGKKGEPVIWKCGKVQVSGSHNDKTEIEVTIKFAECALPFGSESFVFRSSALRNMDVKYTHKVTVFCSSTWLYNLVSNLGLRIQVGGAEKNTWTQKGRSGRGMQQFNNEEFHNCTLH
jgi:hypothetical protein